MAPSPRHRRARHGSTARFTTLRLLGQALSQPLSRPGPTVTKIAAVAAGGALVLSLALPGDEAQASATEANGSAGMMAALGLDQRAEQQVSRATGRTAIAAPALQVPAPAAPMASQEFGSLSFAAVEKPVPPTITQTSPGPSSGSASAQVQGRGGAGYDWAAAQACRCARGLTRNSMAVLAAVKYSFPSMTNIGGVRPDSIPDHPSGRALDFMTSNRGYGDSIANMLISRSGELRIDYIIWRQRIWQPGRGWKMMSNRGSATANHYDHVHVSVR